jgi:hypothetical protein
MPATNHTPNLDLPQYVDGDKFSRLGDLNAAFAAIDTNAGTLGANFTALQTTVSSQITAMQGDISTVETDLAAGLASRYTKTETDQAIAAVQTALEALIDQHPSMDQVTAAITTAVSPFLTSEQITSLINTALVPYAQTANVAPRQHTHTAADITNFGAAVESYLASMDTGWVQVSGWQGTWGPGASGMVMRRRDGFVTINGNCAQMGTAAGTIAILPEGWRPSVGIIALFVDANAATANAGALSISPSGEMALPYTGKTNIQVTASYQV